MAPPKRRGRAAPRARKGRGSATISNQLSGLTTAPAPLLHKFRRVYQETISGAVSGIVAYSPSVTLAKMPSFIEISNLYTEYRFTHVTVLFRPVVSTFSLVGPTSFPVVNSVFDYTNVSALASITSAMQYPSWKQNLFSQMRPHIQIGYVPRCVVSSVLTASGSGLALLPSGTFLTMNNTDVEHFGLKTILQDFPSGVQIEVSFLVDFECRGVKWESGSGFGIVPVNKHQVWVPVREGVTIAALLLQVVYGPQSPCLSWVLRAVHALLGRWSRTDRMWLLCPGVARSRVDTTHCGTRTETFCRSS